MVIDDREFVPSPCTWTNAASMTFIDQPVGVGFSYSEPHEMVVSGLLPQGLRQTGDSPHHMTSQNSRPKALSSFWPCFPTIPGVTRGTPSP